MTRLPYRHALPVALAAAIFTGVGGVYAQGVTDYKPGEGGGPITGSASGVNGAAAKDAAPTLERCPAPLGTVAVAEPQEFVSKALLQYSLPSPTSLIRLMIQQSNCFSVVERGVAMQNIMQERQLQQRGELSQGAQMGQGQLVTADFVLTPDVVFSENNAGGAGGRAWRHRIALRPRRNDRWYGGRGHQVQTGPDEHDGRGHPKRIAGCGRIGFGGEGGLGRGRGARR